MPGSLGLWADIFDQISSMEQRYNKQEVRYQSMIDDFQNVTDAFPDATLIIDQKANLTWFNSAASAMLGLTEPEDIGRPLGNLVRSTDFGNWLAQLKEFIADLKFLPPEKKIPGWISLPFRSGKIKG